MLTGTEAKKKIHDFLKTAKALAIVTVGNPLRRDDGAAIFLGELLKEEIDNVFIANQAPENFVYKLIRERFSHILIIDAAEMNLQSGEMGVIQREDLLQGEIMTHSISIRFFTHLLQKLRRKILIIGIQPEDRGLGQNLSPVVKVGVKEIWGEILEALKS